MNNLDYIKEILTKKFKNIKIYNIIGKGGFGYIFLVKRKEKFYALKFQWVNIHNQNDILEKEYNILLNFKRIEGIPKVYIYKNYFNYSIMIMEILGKNLNSLFKKFNKKFSYITISYISYKIIKILRNIHINNIIHQDIKPKNIIVGSLKNINDIFLIDYGLSIKNDKNNKFIKKKTNLVSNFIIGTPKFCSINGHKDTIQSPKDDLESFGYTLIYLWDGKLQWDRVNDFDKIKELKISFNPNSFKNKFPIITDYFNNIYYNSKGEINYDYLENLFKKELLKNNIDLFSIENDHNKFEWNQSNKNFNKSQNFNIIKKNSLDNFNKKNTYKNKSFLKSFTKNLRNKKYKKNKSYFSKKTEKNLNFNDSDSIHLKKMYKNYKLIEYQKNLKNLKGKYDLSVEIKRKIKDVYVFKVNKFNKFN